MSDRFIDNYLLFQLALASHTFSEEFYAQLRTAGVSPSKWRILLNLIDGPGMYLTSLAKYSLFEQSRVTKLVDQLVGEGLVEKRAGRQDRRRVSIHITNKGTALIAPLIEEAKVHEDSVLERLTPEDRKNLKSILLKLAHRHSGDVKFVI